MLIYAVIVIVLNHKFHLIQGNIELGQFHLIFSFCLAIIISFRIKTAYERWWEGRELWGTLVNNSRNLALRLNKYIGLQNDQDLKNYISTFPLLLKYHLRRDKNRCRKIIANLGISYNEENYPLLLIQKITNKVIHYRSTNQISFEYYLTLDTHISALTDILGGCEKILNTPPPQGFRIFARFALSCYILIFPFGWIQAFELFIIPILIIIIYVLLGLEIIAEEIETPFGNDYNDLDLDSYARNIENNINQIAKNADSR